MFTPKAERAIPFENIVFIGDGATDIPCFRLVKEQGGLSVAVYTPSKPKAKKKAEQYLVDGRVHSVVPASYQEDSTLDKIIKAHIDVIAARIALDALI
jgi:predicted HAD superfamily phosphohydrolase